MVRITAVPAIALLLVLASSPHSAPGSEAEGTIVEYLHRYHELPDGDVAARLELARWCEARSLHHQRAEVLIEVLAIEPNHNQAYRQLLDADARRFYPVDRDWAGRIQGLIDGFRLHHGPHFTLLTDVDASAAEELLGVLEGVYAAFYREASAIGLRPMPPRGRLVVVFFRQYADYRQYLSRFEGIDSAWVGGHYSWRSNRAAFFHDRDNPALRNVRQQIDQADADIAELRRQMAQLPQDQTAARITIQERLRRLTAQHAQWTAALDELTQLTTAARTRHEATHQLLFNSGLQRRGQEYPFWLSEGLAMLFEAADAQGRAGPTHINRYRLMTYRKAAQAGTLLPLIELLSAKVPADADPTQAAARYAQAWVLTAFLWNRRPDQFRRYLDDLTQRQTPDRDVAVFRGHFGDDLAGLGAEMAAFVERMSDNDQSR